MSLPILVALVVVGVSMVIAAVHLTGGSKIAAIEDEGHARQILCCDFPDEAPGPIVITADRRSAFLPLSDGRTGLVQSFGDGFVTRIVAPKDLSALSLSKDGTLSVRFRDFTWTGGEFRFADGGTAAMIAATLDPDHRQQKA